MGAAPSRPGPLSPSRNRAAVAAPNLSLGARGPALPSALTSRLCCCFSGVPGAGPIPGALLSSVRKNTAALRPLAWPWAEGFYKSERTNSYGLFTGMSENPYKGHMCVCVCTCVRVQMHVRVCVWGELEPQHLSFHVPHTYTEYEGCLSPWAGRTSKKQTPPWKTVVRARSLECHRPPPPVPEAPSSRDGPTE